MGLDYLFAEIRDEIFIRLFLLLLHLDSQRDERFSLGDKLLRICLFLEILQEGRVVEMVQILLGLLDVFLAQKRELGVAQIDVCVRQALTALEWRDETKRELKGQFVTDKQQTNRPCQSL